jgi:iron-sulfur cluster repair protein YtfE (RIC family)
MPKPPELLNSDGSASMATLLMMSHHGFRRDLARFARALTALSAADDARAQALGEEWQSFHGALHGHHQVEDSAIFPAIKSQHPELAVCIEGLGADHRRIDPLLEQGDAAFRNLPRTSAALAVVRELQALLNEHLATEEAQLIPQLRAAKDFPPPSTEAEADMYAQGFAWSSHGIAPQVLKQVYALLPAVLTSRLPAAVSAFAQRCERVWGSAKAGAAHTPIPDP